MDHDRATIEFLPSGERISVRSGATLLEAAYRAGLRIDAPCGGGGVCGKCRVRFTSGAPAPSASDRAVFDESRLAAGWRLACCANVTDDAVVEVPETSLLYRRLQMAADRGDIGDILNTDPLPADIRCGEGENRGIALDIGTTTLVGELYDLATGRSRAVESRANPQIQFGDDVISRIKLADERGDGGDMLKAAVLEGVDELIASLLATAAEKPASVRGVTFSGNTTMQHLLCGCDLSGLARLPFRPRTCDPLSIRTDELGLKAIPAAAGWVMPVIGGFVGGDTVGGIIATALDVAGGPRMMMDIGTNGEIVLSCGESLCAASTAAGPALEGARISCGTRAVPGAVEKVVFDDRDERGVVLTVIGGGAPTGVCGSGLIDLLAVLLDLGIVDRSGRMLDRDEAGDLPGAVLSRIRRDPAGDRSFVLHENGDAVLSITSRDVRELQLAAGALRAGIGRLLQRAGLNAADIGDFMLAGGFGGFIRRRSAFRIGLIPPGIPGESVRYVGNLSLHGAARVLMSSTERQRAAAAARRAEHVDLSADPDFQAAFAEAMIFP